MPALNRAHRNPYDYQHEQERQRHRPTVDAGLAHCTEPHCLMPTRWIPPGTPWDLAHNRTTGGYHGPAHRRCNRSEGATHGNTHRTPHHPPAPTDWHSRTW